MGKVAPMRWLAEIWPFVKHAGGASALIGVLLAAAWFSPVFKKDFIYGAIVVAVGLFIYGIGVHDEHAKWNLREQAIIKQVRDAVKYAIENGTKDPYDDPRN